MIVVGEKPLWMGQKTATEVTIHGYGALGLQLLFL